MYKTDLHIHSVLSPCASLEMSPKNIIQRALEEKLDIIAITDHNSTKNIQVTINLANKQNIKVIPGVEVNSSEEIHILAYFPNMESTSVFQSFIEINLPDIRNTNRKFGYQLVVDEDENIIEEIDQLLITSLTCSVEQITDKINQLGGIAIPAHINKPSNSIISQLGFIPKHLDISGIEQSNPINNEILKQYSSYTTITNSDAHYPENIGNHFTLFKIEKPIFSEIKLALLKIQGREVVR